MANFKPNKLNSSPDLVVGHVLFFIYISIIVIIVIVRKEMTKKSTQGKWKQWKPEKVTDWWKSTEVPWFGDQTLIVVRLGMTFFKNFKSQNNLQAILYLMATETFGCRKKLGLWRPFKEGTPHDKFCNNFFSNAHNLGLEWTFGAFSGLKIK